MLVNTHGWKSTLGFVLLLTLAGAVAPVASQPAAEMSGMALRKARILERLVSEAEQALRQGRLTTPLDNNAYDRLRAAEKLSPGNARVAAVMQALRDAYLTRIDSALAQGDAAGAETMLKRAQRISPDSDALMVRRSQLAELYASLPPPSAEPKSGRHWCRAAR